MPQEPTSEELGTLTRAGYVALVGPPNVGKSTLLNVLVGEKLSIVTPKAQTTREPVLGILTTATEQIVFVDTPGLLEAKYRLQQTMLQSALASLADADVVLLLLDATRPVEVPDESVLALLRARRARLVCALNKLDAAPDAAVEKLSAWAVRELGVEALRCSASTGAGLEALLQQLVEKLPPSPFLFPADDLAVQPVRFFVEELVRESVFELYQQEVPYATVVRIEEFREDRQPVYIRATLYVEQESQKPILLGRGGAAIRELGRSARGKIEAFLGQAVYLDLWVKVLHGWRNKSSTLKFLGYPIRDDRGQDS